MKKLITTFISALLFLGCMAQPQKKKNVIYNTDKLIITKLTNHVYIHTTFLQTESFGKVPCNGMIVTSDKEAVVFDTPSDDSTSELLINWITKQHWAITAIVPTHFHGDCLGGLNAFHKHHIPSYANNATITLAKNANVAVPEHGFDSTINLPVGKRKVTVTFFGEGHTKDNVVGYFADENIMFGGCLIKEIDATKGYTDDANLQAWPLTVKKIKKAYPAVKIVVPGHGEYGNKALLDYTIKLFSEK